MSWTMRPRCQRSRFRSQSGSLFQAPPETRRSRRLTALEKRQAPVWLSLPAPVAQEDVEPWRIALRGLLEKHGSALTILEVAIAGQPARLARFAVQVAATEVRANHDAIRLALGGPAMGDRARREEIYSSDLPPTSICSRFPREASRLPPGCIKSIRSPPSSDANAPDVAAADPARVVDGVLDDLGTEAVLHAWRAADLRRRRCARWRR